KLFNNDHPAIAESLTTLADVLLHEDKMDEAKTRLREALAIRQKRLGNDDTALAGTLNVLIEIFLTEQNYAEAEKLLNQTLGPSNGAQYKSPRLLRTLGNFLARTGRWHEAQEAIARAIELEPDNHEAYHELAPLLVQSGDLEAYRQLCQRIRDRF